MTQYSDDQIAALERLRLALFEQQGYIGQEKFNFWPIKPCFCKHPDEFVFASPCGNRVTAAIVRLYRGRVRVQFFHGCAWPRHVRETVVRQFRGTVFFAKHPLNNPNNKHMKPSRYKVWEDYIDPRRFGVHRPEYFGKDFL